MTISYQNRFGDRIAFAAHHLPRHPLVMLVSMGLFLFITFDSIVPGLPKGGSVLAKTVAFLVVEVLLAILIVTFWMVIVLLMMISKRNKPLMARRTFSVGEESFISESVYGRSEVKWLTVQKLARSTRHIFIYVNQENAVVVPRRAFETREQWNEFYEYCRRKASSKD